MAHIRQPPRVRAEISAASQRRNPVARPPSPRVLALREIRDEIRSTREELRETREQLSSRIDTTNERLRIVEVTMLDLAEQQRFVVAHLRAMSPRVHRIDEEVAVLRSRVDAIEARLDRED